MKKFIFNFLFSVSLFSLATLAYAAQANVSDLDGLLGWFNGLVVKIMIPLMFGVGTASFIYGILKYFLNPENVAKQGEGKKFVTWGLVGMFLMVSMWGIVYIFTNTFGFQNTIPQIKTSDTIK